MSVEDTKAKIAVMQAYVDGKTIQGRNAGSDQPWGEIGSPIWHWIGVDYRVAPATPRELWVVYSSTAVRITACSDRDLAVRLATESGGTYVKFIEVL